MTHSVYTLCGFQKHNPVGFCVFCEIYGNYIQRNHKYKRGGRLNIIRSLHDKNIIRPYWMSRLLFKISYKSICKSVLIAHILM